jgi:hypothetical protein
MKTNPDVLHICLKAARGGNSTGPGFTGEASRLGFEPAAKF